MPRLLRAAADLKIARGIFEVKYFLRKRRTDLEMITNSAFVEICCAVTMLESLELVSVLIEISQMNIFVDLLPEEIFKCQFFW